MNQNHQNYSNENYNSQLEKDKKDKSNINNYKEININNENSLIRKIEKSFNNLNGNDIKENKFNINLTFQHQNKSLFSILEQNNNSESIYNGKNSIITKSKNISLNNSSKSIEKEENLIKHINNNFSDIFTEKDKITIRLFIDYIHSLILLENKAENLRESTCLCEDISLLEIYYKFDLNQNNLISKENFKDICNKEYYLFPTEKEIQLLFNRFDLDKDGHLNFEEFMNLISPLKKEYITLYEENENVNCISFESKKKIIEILKIILENEIYIYELKSKLISHKDFNFIDLWGLLMKYSKDNLKLDKNEFNYFLESFGCYLTKYELDIIFYKLAKGNNEIKYNDLYKEIIN